MLVDLGTRKGAKLVDVSQDSQWINGYEWMKLDQNDFPTKTVNEIKLNYYIMKRNVWTRTHGIVVSI